MSFNDIIKNQMEKQEVTQARLAKIAGVSQPTITKFLKGSTEISLYSVFKIVRFLFEQKSEYKVMELFIRSIKKRKENLRYALEYCSLNKQIDLLGSLISSEQVSNNDTNREWAKIYKAFYDLATNSKSTEEILLYMRSVRCNSDEMYILSRIIEGYIYYVEKRYGTMMDVSRGVYQEIQGIENDFIRKSFSTRIGLNYANIYFRSNDLEKSRHYINEVIESDLSKRYTVAAFHILALTYVFEAPDKSFEALRKAKDTLRGLNLIKEERELNKTYDFINNLWGIEEVSENNQAEVAHREIKKGNHSKALEILSQLKTTPFTLYYQGLASNNVYLIWDAFEIFLSRGDLFFANLPRQELLKRGESRKAVETAYNSSLKLAGV